MLSHSFGLVAISTIVVNALVLPPGIASEGNSNPVNTLVHPKTQSITISCPACVPISSIPEALEDLDPFWNDDDQSDLDVVLNFAVSQDGERLELNGEPIFPPQFHREAHLQGRPIYINRISALGAQPDVPLEITSSVLKIESGHPVWDDGDTVIPLRLFILALEGQKVNSFPEVAVNLLSTSDGELFIMRVDQVASSDLLISSFAHDRFEEVADREECSMLPARLCRLRRILAHRLAGTRLAKFGQRRPCRHGKGHSVKHVKTKSGHQGSKARLQFRPSRPNHKAPHSHKNHKFTFFRSFSRLAIAVLIPIMAGILVGLSVCFLGLLTGRLVGYLWARFVRRDSRRFARIALDDSEDDLSKILIDGQEIDPVPAYEEAPPYEEFEAEQR